MILWQKRSVKRCYKSDGAKMNVHKDEKVLDYLCMYLCMTLFFPNYFSLVRALLYFTVKALNFVWDLFSELRE